MELSLRLEKVASLVEPCRCVADIGTDHAYIPIYLVERNICSHAIASDINRGPLEKASKNISLHGLEEKIECRMGSGFNTLKKGEADVAIISGMGGNLIRDIIEERMDLFMEFKSAVLQPVQNPEVLREYIYNKGFEILDEELSVDENKFYEIMKIRYDEKKYDVDSIFYEISKKLFDERHPEIKSFIRKKYRKYSTIISQIQDDTPLANERKAELNVKLGKLREMLECL
ncbi:MAG: tRNA (adenine(22)-N(1))-methyltransferase TrmK [Clostridiaceae bacterium]